MQPSISKSLTGDLLARIEFVKDRLSFGEMLSYYGIAWAGDDEHQLSCHFHGKDKNPSAHYYPHPEKRIWCFACQEGGDVIWWIKKREGLRNVGEALDFIQRIFNIGLDNTDLSKRIEQERQLKEQRSKRECYARLVTDRVNDTIHSLRQRREKGERLDALEQLIFDRKYEIDRTHCTYLDYVGLLRQWSGWSQELLKKMSLV